MTYPAENTLQDAANRINSRIATIIGEAIAIGRELIEAKENAPHGQFERIFYDHPNPIAHPVQMSARRGRSLMALARNEVICARWQELPNAIDTLLELDRMTEDNLAALVDAKTVTPATTAEQAKAIVAEVRRPAAKTPEISPTSEAPSEIVPESTVLEVSAQSPRMAEVQKALANLSAHAFTLTDATDRFYTAPAGERDDLYALTDAERAFSAAILELVSVIAAPASHSSRRHIEASVFDSLRRLVSEREAAEAAEFEANKGK